MANILQQQNTLKGLTDESLSEEMSAPSGSAPPFLVLAELNRRKTMRQSYEGEMARKGKSTTVAEDLAGQGLGAMPSTGGMGLPMAPEMAGADMGGLPPQGFAMGGIVGKKPYLSDYATRYDEMLAGLPEDRNSAADNALIQAGLAIMGGKSSNFMNNIGAALPAAQGYQQEMNALDSREMDMLSGRMGVDQLQHADELARLDRDYSEREAARRASEFDRSLAAGDTTASIRNADHVADIIASGDTDALNAWQIANPSSVTAGPDTFKGDLDTIKAFQTLAEDVAKQIAARPEYSPETLMLLDDTEKAAAQAAMAEEIKAILLTRTAGTALEDYALQQLRSMPSTAAPAANMDPLGLGL